MLFLRVTAQILKHFCVTQPRVVWQVTSNTVQPRNGSPGMATQETHTSSQYVSWSGSVGLGTTDSTDNDKSSDKYYCFYNPYQRAELARIFSPFSSLGIIFYLRWVHSEYFCKKNLPILPFDSLLSSVVIFHFSPSQTAFVSWVLESLSHLLQKVLKTFSQT